jgi:hypothetical protein
MDKALDTARPEYWDSKERDLRLKKSDVRIKLDEIEKMKLKIAELERRKQQGKLQGKSQSIDPCEGTKKRKLETQSLHCVPLKKLSGGSAEEQKARRAARFSTAPKPPPKPKRDFAWSGGEIKSNKEQALEKYLERTKKKEEIRAKSKETLKQFYNKNRPPTM